MAGKKRRTISLDDLQTRIEKNVKKERQKTRRDPEELLFEALAREGAIPVDLARRERTIEVVRAALDELTPLQRVVLWEREVRKQTFREIWQSKIYKNVTKKGYTSLSRVSNIYFSAVTKFKRAMSKSGILEEKK